MTNTVRRLLKRLFRPAPPRNKFRIPREWSNSELARFAPSFSGDIVNVSGWTDADKQGKKYRDYFTSANSYTITNYHPEQKGLVGTPGEIFLDLEQQLPHKMHGAFDVVFNHTTLEHIFDFRMAFKNICTMTRNVVILVVPYIQQIHGIGYSDYWRFTPHSLKRLFEDEGMNLRYCSANGSDKASIYLFAIATRDDSWNHIIPQRFDLSLDPKKPLYGNDLNNVIGGNVIS